MTHPVSYDKPCDQALVMPAVRRLGSWSAFAVLLTVILFGSAVLFGMLGFSGQRWAYLAGLLLAPSFVVMMACIHCQASAEKQIWSLVGLCFAVVYAVLVSLVYYAQLTAVRSAGAELLPFVFTPGTVFFALDMLGYGFMCLATWFTAAVFDSDHRLSLWIRRLFVLHGWLVFPTVIVPVLLPGPSAGTGGTAGVFDYVALLGWCAVFVPLSYLVARYFLAGKSERD